MQRWAFRVLLAAAVAVGLGYLPYHLYGPEGISQILRLERQYETIQEHNQALLKENRALMEQIRRLKKDPQAIGRVARDELGLVRSDDLVFQFE